MEQVILLNERKDQWEKLVGWKASMTVRHLRPVKIDLPARTLVCVDGFVVGEMLVTHFLKTHNPAAFSKRAYTSPKTLEEYAADEPVYGWTIADVVVYDRPVELAELGLAEAPASWKLMEVKEEFPVW